MNDSDHCKPHSAFPINAQFIAVITWGNALQEAL